MSEKKTYYIEIASGEISQSPYDSPWNFKIDATKEEITTLRKYFDESHTVGIGNFIRAHIPFLEYHHDNENDIQDEKLQQVYRMIHQLGDEEAKQHIKSMGILENI
jgi:hypothetical protein